jgi:hypothetical protein
VNNPNVNSPQDPQFRKTSWSLFLQDGWKITRRLTLDYGIRWDYQGQGHEIHNRLAEFSPSTANPSAGGLLGATSYDGYGPGRCNCSFTHAYPYVVGPRLGLAYQIDSKTVLRAGWGVTYGPTDSYNYITNAPILGVGFNQLVFTSPSYGVPRCCCATASNTARARCIRLRLIPAFARIPARSIPRHTGSIPTADGHHESYSGISGYSGKSQKIWFWKLPMSTTVALGSRRIP